MSTSGIFCWFSLVWEGIPLLLQQHRTWYLARGLLDTHVTLPPASWHRAWTQASTTTSGIHTSYGYPNLCPHISMATSFAYWVISPALEIISCLFYWFYGQLFCSICSPFWVIWFLKLILLQCGFPVVIALIALKIILSPTGLLFHFNFKKINCIGLFLDVALFYWSISYLGIKPTWPGFQQHYSTSWSEAQIFFQGLKVRIR